MKILALMTDAYGGFGGIAQYNRDLLDAVNEIEEVESVVSISRLHPQSNMIHPGKLTEYSVSGNVLIYTYKGIRMALKVKPDLILCGHINLLPVAVLLKRLFGVPVLLELYGIDAWTPVIGLVKKWAVNQIDFALSISRYTRFKFLCWSNLTSDRMWVMPNAIHLNRYKKGKKPEYLIERYGLHGKQVLLTLGRLSAYERYKGHDRILQLLPKLINKFSDLVYVIAGDGDDRSRLELLVEKLLVKENVMFVGRVSDEEIIDHYNMADAFAMPSTGEGFGFVFLEAAACGVPVLGGGEDGSRDALVDGYLGIMVNPDESKELYEGLVRLMQTPRNVPSCLVKFSFCNFQKNVQEIIWKIINFKKVKAS